MQIFFLKMQKVCKNASGNAIRVKFALTNLYEMYEGLIEIGQMVE